MAKRNIFPNPELKDTSGDGLTDNAWASSFDNDYSITTTAGSDTLVTSTSGAFVGFGVGQKVVIHNLTGTTPDINGVHTVKALVSATQFSIEQTTTGSGSGGELQIVALSQTNPYLVGSDGIYLGKSQKIVYKTDANEGTTAYLHLGRTLAGSVVKHTGDSYAQSGGNAVITSNGHGMKVDEKVFFSGSTHAALDGTKTITAADTNTFTVVAAVGGSGTTTWAPQLAGSVWIKATITDSLGQPSAVGGIMVRGFQWAATGSWGYGSSSINGAQLFLSGGNIVADGNWQRKSMYITATTTQLIADTCDFVDVCVILGTAATPNLTFTIEVSNVQVHRDTSYPGWFSGVYGGTWEGTAHASVTSQDVAALTDLDPDNGPAGTSLLISGTDLGVSGVVKWDGVDGPAATFWSPTSIRTTVPDGETGTPEVSVVPAEGGGSTSGHLHFTIAVPTITALTPSTQVPGLPVTISGTNLGTMGLVTVGTANADVRSWKSDGTEVVITVPSLAAGSYDVVVKPASGGATAPSTLTVSKIPAVVFSGSVWKQALVAAYTAGSTWKAPTSVSVYTEAGAWKELGVTGYEASKPLISLVTPTLGVAGDTVEIQGSGFGATQGSSTVKFGTTSVGTCPTWSDNRIVCVAPSLSGTQAVKVTVSAVDSNTVNFVYESTGKIINVTTLTTLAISNALATAQAGDTVLLGPGKFLRTGGTTTVETIYVPDYVTLRGQGIWNQGRADGGGGTWVEARLRWGSYCKIEKMLVGHNTGQTAVTGVRSAVTGVGCYHKPEAKTTTRAGYEETRRNGAHHTTLNLVRFKAGNYTTGGKSSVIELGDNYRRSRTESPLGPHWMCDHYYNDCEFERAGYIGPEPNTSGWQINTSTFIMDAWWDYRPGGAEMSRNHLRRCHFGVKNGYWKGNLGRGLGKGAIICQSVPTGPAAGSDNPWLSGYDTHRWDDPDCGPSTNGGSDIRWDYPRVDASNPMGGYGYQPPNSPYPPFTGNWNPIFAWDTYLGIDAHMANDWEMVDCLFEYETGMCTLNICDWARNWSTWQCSARRHTHLSGAGLCPSGFGNPPGSQWGKPWKYTPGLAKTCYDNNTPQLLTDAGSPPNAANQRWHFERCVAKSGNIFETGANHHAINCYPEPQASGKGWINTAPSGGNLNEGTFAAAKAAWGAGRPSSPIFTVDWNTASGWDNYTASPFDPSDPTYNPDGT